MNDSFFRQIEHTLYLIFRRIGFCTGNGDFCFASGTKAELETVNMFRIKEIISLALWDAFAQTWQAL